MTFKIIVAFSIGIYLLAGEIDQSVLPTKHFYGVKLRDSYRMSAQLHDELAQYI